MIKIRDLLIVQLIAWTIFILFDWIEETFSVEFWMEICFGLPIIIGLLYFIKRKLEWSIQKQLTFRKKLKQFGILILSWVLITIPVIFIITALVINNNWIISQHRRFLDGLEYTVFGIFLLIIPTVILLIGEFLIWVKKIKMFHVKH